MGKIIIIAAILALATAVPTRLTNERYRNLGNNVSEIIQQYRYPVQNYTVQTSDGYILDLIRIPHGVENQNEEQVVNRPAVVVFHGLLSSADDFVMGGPSQGLAFYLSEHGYDVYLANARGSVYGMKHSMLNSQRDGAFWRFSFHEVGVKDLSSVIDKVIEISGRNDVMVVGHNQGATAAFVLLSEMPEYNQKVSRVVALGPLTFMQHTSNVILRLVAQNQQSKAWLIKHLGQNQYNPSKDLLSETQYDCMAQNVDEEICNNLYFMFNGYSSNNLNMTTVRDVMHHVPAGASAKQFLHLAQLVNTGHFEKFMTAPDDHQEYDLSRITVPVVIFNTPSDSLSNVEDVNMLRSKLSNVEIVNFNQLTNNVDLLWGNNVQRVVYDKMTKYMPKSNKV